MANNIYIILSGDKGPETLRQILQDLTASNTAAGVESPRLEAEPAPALEVAKEPQGLEAQALEAQALEAKNLETETTPAQEFKKNKEYFYLKKSTKQILEYINSRGGGPVNSYDVSAALNKNIVAVRGNLRNLAKYGLLDRLARGIYILSIAGREAIR